MKILRWVLNRRVVAVWNTPVAKTSVFLRWTSVKSRIWWINDWMTEWVHSFAFQADFFTDTWTDRPRAETTLSRRSIDSLWRLPLMMPVTVVRATPAMSATCWWVRFWLPTSRMMAAVRVAFTSDSAARAGSTPRDKARPLVVLYRFWFFIVISSFESLSRCFVEVFSVMIF